MPSWSVCWQTNRKQLENFAHKFRSVVHAGYRNISNIETDLAPFRNMRNEWPMAIVGSSIVLAALKHSNDQVSLVSNSQFIFLKIKHRRCFYFTIVLETNMYTRGVRPELRPQLDHDGEAVKWWSQNELKDVQKEWRDWDSLICDALFARIHWTRESNNIRNIRKQRSDLNHSNILTWRWTWDGNKLSQNWTPATTALFP
jgi:hypothetical protein